jgi:hypothetical protein
MDLMEITETGTMSREDAAAWPHALADALARHNDVEFDRGGLRARGRAQVVSSEQDRKQGTP